MAAILSGNTQPTDQGTTATIEAALFNEETNSFRDGDAGQENVESDSGGFSLICAVTGSCNTEGSTQE